MLLHKWQPRSNALLASTLWLPVLLRLLSGPSLLEAVTPAELADDTEYGEILEDMRDECGKYGKVRTPPAAVH